MSEPKRESHSTMVFEPKIFVATHKKSEMPNDPRYIPIHVGKALSDNDFGYDGDDTGDNISTLNHSFCECTGLYWISKNVDSKYIGLVHYRRHFAASNKAIDFKDRQIAHPTDFHEFSQNVSLVVAPPHVFWNTATNTPITLETQYMTTAVAQDLFLIREAIGELHRDYLDAFDFTMKSCHMNAYNMFVGLKSVSDEYADWLFSLLFLLEKRIPYEFYDDYQKRVFGFIAERLFTVWINKNRGRYRIVSRDVLYFE